MKILQKSKISKDLIAWRDGGVTSEGFFVGIASLIYCVRLYMEARADATWAVGAGKKGGRADYGRCGEVTQSKALMLCGKTNETYSGLQSLIKVRGKSVF